jgi:hypothetical protein
MELSGALHWGGRQSIRKLQKHFNMGAWQERKQVSLGPYFLCEIQLWSSAEAGREEERKGAKGKWPGLK